VQLGNIGPQNGETALPSGFGPVHTYSLVTYITAGENIMWVMDPGNNFYGNATEFTGTISSVPEPSSIVAFCGLGAMGLFLIARRRRES